MSKSVRLSSRPGAHRQHEEHARCRSSAGARKSQAARVRLARQGVTHGRPVPRSRPGSRPAASAASPGCGPRRRRASARPRRRSPRPGSPLRLRSQIRVAICSHSGNLGRGHHVLQLVPEGLAPWGRRPAPGRPRRPRWAGRSPVSWKNRTCCSGWLRNSIRRQAASWCGEDCEHHQARSAGQRHARRRRVRAGQRRGGPGVLQFGGQAARGTRPDSRGR